VVAASPGGAERRALLGSAERLADERVDVDDQAPVAGTGAGRPARWIASSRTRSSWRTWPNVNARKNVPKVEGAITRCPSTLAVRPARNTSQSSMQSAPSAIADTNVITSAPPLPAPSRSPRSTRSSTSASIPSRPASVAVNTIPASATAR